MLENIVLGVVQKWRIENEIKKESSSYRSIAGLLKEVFKKGRNNNDTERSDRVFKK